MIDPSSFIDLPSPVEKLELFDCPNLYIKRDDLINSTISGNKWRKLSTPLMQAQKEKKSHLVSFGGAYSNHLIALAFAAQALGFESTGIVRGEELKHKALNPILRRSSELGMKLRFVSRESYREKRVLFNGLYADDQNAFFIDEGGKSELGIEGCREIIREMDWLPDHIVLATGTGTTMAGVCRELRIRMANTEVHGVCALKGYDSNEDYNCFCKDGYEEAKVYHDGHFGGFAKSNNELNAFAHQMNEEKGIRFDSTYNAKALFKLKKLIEENKIDRKDKILFLHTGGYNLEFE